MARSTRNRRGEGVATMQDDPEAILRRRRQTARAARGRAPHSRTGSLSLPHAREAVHDDQGEQSRQNDAGARDASEQNQANPSGTEVATQSADEQRGNDPTLQNATIDEGQSNGHHEQADDVSGPQQNEPGAAAETDQPYVGTTAEEERTQDAREETTNDTASSPQPDDAPSTSTGQATDSADEDEAGFDPEGTQHAVDNSPARDQETAEQPALTPCQRMRAALEALQRDAANAPALPQDCLFNENAREYLPSDTLHQAIASVTEAISERGLVLFSLIDRFFEQQQAARPGQTLLWPQHRARDAGGAGHHSLFIAHLVGDGEPYHVEHRDSYRNMRDTESVQDAWQESRALLTGAGVFQWDRLAGGAALSQEAHVPNDQFDQIDGWTCGIFTILNAWMHALGLSHSHGRRQTRECIPAASAFIRHAMQGRLSSATIRDFLECFGFIDHGVEVAEDRAFDHTFALPSGAALMDRVARVRLADERALFLQQNPIRNARSVDEMVETLEQQGGPVNLLDVESFDRLLALYTDAMDQMINDGNSDEDEDAAMARRMQREEYQQDAIPGQQQVPAAQQGPQVPDAPQQQADAWAHERDPAVRQRPQAAAGQPRQANPLAQGNTAEQALADVPQGAQINPLFLNPGSVEIRNRVDEETNSGADAQPPANMQNRPPAKDEGPTAEQAQQDEEAARRRQRAFDLLRPADDPFRPDAPLREPSATARRGMDAGFSELSMLVAPYSDLPRHQTIRERFDLPNLTHAFDAGVQQPGAQPARAAAAPASVAPAATAPTSDAPQDRAAASETSAPLADASRPVPATGQPAIPGLQSTIPAAPTSPPQRPDPAVATADQAPPGTRGASAESQGSPRSLEYYEREEEREEAERQAAALAHARGEFEQETSERRQRARERRRTPRQLEDDLIDLGDDSEDDDLDESNDTQRTRARERGQNDLDDELRALASESEPSEEDDRDEEQRDEAERQAAALVQARGEFEQETNERRQQQREREEERTRDAGQNGASNEEQAMPAARGGLDALRAQYGPLPVDEEGNQQGGRAGDAEEVGTGYDSLFEGDVDVEDDDSGTEAGDGIPEGDEGDEGV